MNCSNPADEAPSERLLMIYVEALPSWPSPYRHIVGQVVRRAMRDEWRSSDTTGASGKVYYDGANATGYRWATWSGPLAKDRYCDGMRVRGQFDTAGPEQMAEGQPYGNRVSFKCDTIEHREAKGMAEMFRLLEKKEASLRDKGYRWDDTFADQCRLLMLSLGITKFVVAKRQLYGTPNLDQPELFTEYGISDLDDVIARVVYCAHHPN